MSEPRFLRLLQDHPQSLDDRRQFTGLLKDFMPGLALQTNLLIYLYDLGIHKAIQEAEIIG